MKPKDIWSTVGVSSSQKILLGLLLLALASSKALAQEIPFDTDAPSTPAANTASPPPPSNTGNYPSDLDFNAQTSPQRHQTQRMSTTTTVPTDISGLGRLAPFSDIAVISRRYLPKTNRFEFFPNFGFVLNDAFFNDFSMGARIGYYFTENYGIELTGQLLSTSTKTVTDELQQQRDIATQSFATPTSYYGADFKWDPIYGKLGFMNKTIVPFDFYFSVGGGVTATNQNTTAPTFHVGAGQLFALSKWLAARWDVSWMAYNTTSQVAGGSSGTYSNLYFTIGASFFFPEAGYR